MKILYTKQEFDKARGKDKLPLECSVCCNTFYQEKRVIQRVINDIKGHKSKFCSKKCVNSTRNIPLTVQCKNCEIYFQKTQTEIRKNTNHFCSQSCAATYNNTHKTKGTRISKLEVWLLEQLTICYPDIEIHYNRKDAINSELDIYIPSLKLAFELNGIFHYEPIYGPDKLQQIQNNDDRKFQACLERKIELVIIDTSSQKYFKDKTSLKFLNIIKTIIESKLTTTFGFGDRDSTS